MNIIEIYNLTKYHNAKSRKGALKKINANIKKGELFGIIGPDGAGKTTLFNILTMLDSSYEGEIKLNLTNSSSKNEMQNKIGYMPEKFSLYYDLTIKENINFFSSIYNVSSDIISQISVYKQREPFKDRIVIKLSGGMKQKLALCCTLLHNPEILFLDEPTTGVDPISRTEFWNILNELKGHGVTIVISTPYMDEASFCDRIAFIQKGKMFSIDTPANILNKFPEALWAIQSDNMYKLLKDLRNFYSIKTCFAFGHTHHITVGSGFTKDSLMKYLTINNHKNITIEQIPPGIEDCFMLLTKNRSDE